MHRLKITLAGIKPPIWRRVELLSNGTFWDLHCAITDAMGWEDVHLHAFSVGDRRNRTEIGIPMESDMGLDDTVPAGWDVSMATYLTVPGDRCTYTYDFGDDWTHEVTVEAVVPREAKAKYPRCLAGARACPPEECGGVAGYQQLLALLADPGSADEDGEDILDCFADHDPETFDPGEVRFHSAARRLKALLGPD